MVAGCRWREDLKRSNDDLVAIARDEDVILVDVDAWREAATRAYSRPRAIPRPTSASVSRRMASRE